MQVFLFLFLSTFNLTDSCNLDQIRSTFFSITNESQLTNYIELCDSSNCKESEFYKSVAIMWKAEYTYWPHQKYALFTEGKNMLEDLIKEYPNNTELRFLRYIVQVNTPRFLGYKDNINNDLSFINSNLTKEDYSNSHKELILETIEFANKNNE
jgi:hypothetical protein